MHLKVHGLLRGSVRNSISPKPLSEAEAPAISAEQPEIQPRFELEPATTSSGKFDQTVRVKGQDGNHLEITHQIQLYTTNPLLKHPLVSPVLAYLGGLPPLFVIASDREALRDEIIYTLVNLTSKMILSTVGLTSAFDSAHRAADPSKYPVSEETKRLYPAVAGVEGRMRPTKVHLQVYDGVSQPIMILSCSASTSPTVDVAHVLPLAFIATTPAKYCYRAIATFIKHVTNMPPTASLQRRYEPPAPRPSIIAHEETVVSPIASSPLGGDLPAASSQAKERSPSRLKGFSRVTSSFRRGSPLFSKSSKNHFEFNAPEDEGAIEDTLAGDPVAYDGGWVSSSVQTYYRNLTAPGKLSRPSGYNS
jgi:hypothetical protein